VSYVYLFFKGANSETYVELHCDMKLGTRKQWLPNLSSPILFIFSLFVSYLCQLESVLYSPTPPIPQQRVPQNGPGIIKHINEKGILCNLPGLFRLEFWWTDQHNIAKSPIRLSTSHPHVLSDNTYTSDRSLLKN
jgi:hypothetical protein